MVTALTVVAVMFGGLAVWSLYHPSSSRAQAQAERESDFAKETNESRSDEGGAERATTIYYVQTQNQNYIAPQSEEQRHWYANPDWWVAGFTAALFIATAGLWFFTGLLWRATNALVRSEREIVEKQERPYLYVFDVMMPRKSGPAGEKPPSFMFYDVGNFGKAPAIIDNVMTGVEIRDDGQVPDLLRENEDYRLFVSFIMKPDKQQDKISAHFSESVIILEKDFRFVPQLRTDQDLFFRILIEYHGPFSAGHVTEGWWRYDVAAESFVRVNDQEHNRVT
ncbi:MAG TPA: hypothetical protein VMC06_10810 [Opitutaceae bacterium]|nr:hypothetical protein [Opitutaceae bacterium]